MVFTTALLLNALAAASFAQTPPKDAAAATGAITGRVTDDGGEDAQPLAGVGIMLMSSARGFNTRGPVARATTGADGSYRLANVPAGSYQLQILAPGYSSADALSTQGIGAGRAINIEAGETIEHQDFTLARGGVITGRVTDADGKPVIAEHIRLFHTDRNPQTGSFNPRVVYGFETDDRGVYRIYGLTAGRYLVCVGEEGERRAVATAFSGRNHTRTCHPNATEDAQAKVVEVSAGNEATGVDITLAPPAKTFEATGRIVDAFTGQPMANLAYGFGVLSPEGKHIGSRGYSNTRTNAAGEFRIGNLLPGRYVVFLATREGDATNFYSEPLPFQIDEGNLSGLVMKVRRGAIMRGVASVEGTSDRAVLAKLSQVSLQVHVSPSRKKADEVDVRNSSRLALQPDGSFYVSGLAPGMAQITLDTFSTPPGFRLLGVERGASGQSDGIEIGEGEQVSNVRVRLAYGTTVLRGRIDVRRDGEPSQLPEGGQMYVTLQLAGGVKSGRNDLSAEVDVRGRFVIEGLVAGEYELTARGWIRPSPPARQGGALPTVTQTVSVPDKGEINVTVVYEQNAKPQVVTP
jgi:hypothetical protein